MASLCLTCSHVREVVSGTGSKFRLCLLSQQSNRFPKYPPQPVLRCDGHEVKVDAMTSLALDVLPGRFAICRLESNADVPDWATGDLVSITRTPDELSVVCPQECVPEDIRSEPDWRSLRVAGPLDFSMVGVIASLTETLARANISVFVISTFDTDYVLVKESDLKTTVESLGEAGHAILGM